MHPTRASEARLGKVHSYFLANSDFLHILGQENATFWGNSSYYSLAQLPWLLHVLNILSAENATFWGDSCYFSLTQIKCLLHVMNILGPENATFWGDFSYYSLIQL